ncbi:hypothetical protein ACVWZ4_006254 [Bradyrhizobium sp. USDA 4472]
MTSPAIEAMSGLYRQARGHLHAIPHDVRLRSAHASAVQTAQLLLRFAVRKLLTSETLPSRYVNSTDMNCVAGGSFS